MTPEEMERRLKIATTALEKLIKYIPYKDCESCWSHEVAAIALREMDRTKWTFEKLDAEMAKLGNKYCNPDGTFGEWSVNHPAYEALLKDAGWGCEEYEWEGCRHYNTPPTCACWDKHPENKGMNPLPL
jgi:hypothetical protein